MRKRDEIVFESELGCLESEIMSNEAKEVEGVELFDQPIKVDVGSEFVDCWQFGPDFFEETVF